MRLAEFASRHNAAEWVLYEVLVDAGIELLGDGLLIKLADEAVPAADAAVQAWAAKLVTEAMRGEKP